MDATCSQAHIGDRAHTVPSLQAAYMLSKAAHIAVTTRVGAGAGGGVGWAAWAAALRLHHGWPGTIKV
jgi:glycerate kinase